MNAHCNFINSPSPSHYEAFKRWWHYSKIFFGLCAATLAALIVAYAGIILTLMHKRTTLASTSVAHNQQQQTFTKMQEQETELHKRLCHLKTLSQPTQLQRILNEITDNLPDDVRFTDCDLHKRQECHIKGYARASASLMKFINQLKTAAWCETIKLCSLQQVTIEQQPLLAYTISFVPKIEKTA